MLNFVILPRLFSTFTFTPVDFAQHKTVRCFELFKKQNFIWLLLVSKHVVLHAYIKSVEIVFISSKQKGIFIFKEEGEANYSKAFVPNVVQGLCAIQDLVETKRSRKSSLTSHFKC